MQIDNSRASHLKIVASALGALVLMVNVEPAFAIPSPELIVGSISSVSQLIALVSALLGGGALAVGSRAMRKRGGENASPWPKRLAFGFGVLSLALIGLNVWQFTSDRSALQDRLEATLIRPTPRAVGGKTLDPTLKEVTYSEQQSHPRGISTADMEALLEAKQRGEKPDDFLMDIRETAETEMGTLPGSKIVRYPDVFSSNVDFKGKTAYVFCHNGNRGFETCEALHARGIDCRFLVGGLEKWLVENRSLTGFRTRSLEDLRALAPFRNQTTLIDTPEVKKMVQDEGAVFIDVRYPGEFSSGALPGAINLPIRPTPTDTLKKAIADLPNKPIIVPCYDRRSCFFGEVLGLELSRAGRDFRGRYTLPWEYFIATPPRPYIQQWLEENRQSYWSKGAEELGTLVRRVADHIGVVLAIILLAMISRLCVAPFSIKAERDQISAKLSKDEFEAIKIENKDDPARRSRMIRAYYKRHNMTPMRNLIALLFLPVMAMAMVAVQHAVTGKSEGWLWITDLAERDHLLILPVIFGALIALYIDLAFATNWKQRALIWVITLPLLGATAALLGAGSDIYLVTSAALLLVQRAYVSGVFGRAIEAFRHRGLGADIITLDAPASLEGLGNKAYRLGVMRDAGFPVPEGVLLTPAFLERFQKLDASGRKTLLDRLWSRLGGHQLAVRSSATDEDGAGQSFAGVFESVIDINREKLEGAIAAVRASFAADRVKGYMANGGTGSVLLQRMVHAQYSGVLFTRDPSAGGLAMVEMVEGTAENLVSGLVRPSTFRFGRVTGERIGDVVPKIDLGPLLILGRKAEKLFGGPQDIEWTYVGGHFYIVQSRDITSVVGDPKAAAIQNEYARVIDLVSDAKDGDMVFAKNELSEMLPRPTQMSLSLMEALWAKNGSVDLAAHELGLSYKVNDDANYLATIMGRLYVNRSAEKGRALVVGKLGLRKLLRNADKIESEFREKFLPNLLHEIRILNAVDFEQLSPEELVEEIARLYNRFVHDTHVQIDVVNVAAGIYLETARQGLTKAHVEPSAVLGHIPLTFENKAIAELAEIPEKTRRWSMLKTFGHRASLDYELAEPRYAEDFDALSRSVSGRQHLTAHHFKMPSVDESLAKQVDIARRFQTLKEDAKHHSLAELAILRRALLSLDRRFGFNGNIFNLRFDEALTLNSAKATSLKQLAEERRQLALLLAEAPSLGFHLTINELEAASGGKSGRTTANGEVRGTRVSGSAVIEGRARVMSDIDAEQGNLIDDLRDGDVIVATMINPNWLPYFSKAGGLVSEVGGWLSHPAILAREFDVAMIVGTEGIGQIKEGAMLRLHLDGHIELLDHSNAQAVAAA